MSFSVSVITSTGFPFYMQKISEEPQQTDINLRFYNFVNENLSEHSQPEQTFELQTGLISALYEFARILDHPIEYLKFKTGSKSNEGTIERESQ